MARIDRVKYLAEVLRSLSESEMENLILNARNENAWFTEDSIRESITGICHMLEDQKIDQWLAKYKLTSSPSTVGLVMAGNIPMVGFHDLLSVYLSGHNSIVKLSHQDSVLMKFVIQILREEDSESIELVERLSGMDAVIATGSSNTSRYFDYYFGKYPNIIRKNRTSIAVLDGNETEEELTLLGKDIFSYFGLGCRNVSSLKLPEGFNIERLATSWEDFSNVINHHKYANNYDYNKSIFLVNMVEHLDFGYVLLRESNELFTPISVLNITYYKNEKELSVLLTSDAEKIQCVVGTDVPFGKAQLPELWDYADGVDTMEFLQSL